MKFKNQNFNHMFNRNIYLFLFKGTRSSKNSNERNNTKTIEFSKVHRLAQIWTAISRIHQQTPRIRRRRKHKHVRRLFCQVKILLSSLDDGSILVACLIFIRSLNRQVYIAHYVISGQIVSERHIVLKIKNKITKSECVMEYYNDLLILDFSFSILKNYTDIW